MSVEEEQRRLRPKQTHREEITNTGNMSMNRTLLELEPSCPAGTSGTVVTPAGGSIHGREMGPQTLYGAKGQFATPCLFVLQGSSVR